MNVHQEVLINTREASICNDKVKIKELLGKGSWGFVHRGYIKETKQNVVIKFQQHKKQYNKEVKAINRIQNHIQKHKLTEYADLFPKVFFNGEVQIQNVPVYVSNHFHGCNDFYYIVMDQFGKSMTQVNNIMDNIPAILQMGIQLISLLEVVHDCGLVHNDLKSSNFLCGQNR